jgi:hypothetical protein
MFSMMSAMFALSIPVGLVLLATSRSFLRSRGKNKIFRSFHLHFNIMTENMATLFRQFSPPDFEFDGTAVYPSPT